MFKTEVEVISTHIVIEAIFDASGLCLLSKKRKCVIETTVLALEFTSQGAKGAVPRSWRGSLRSGMLLPFLSKAAFALSF